MKPPLAHESLVPGILLALAGTFMFSLKPILIKHAYAMGVSSEQLITLRMLFAIPFYIGVILYYSFRNAHIRHLYVQYMLPVAALGVLGYFVASYLDLLGLQYISAQLERVVLFCFPTIVVLMSYFFFKTRLPKNIWLLLGMSYAGILLIFGHDLSVLGTEVAKGTALVFLSAIAFAIYVLWSKPIMSKIGSQVFTSMAMVAASIVILVFFFVSQSTNIGSIKGSGLLVSKEAYLVCAAIAFFCTVIPSLLVAEAIHKIGPERTSIVGTSGPAITSVFAVTWLGEPFTVYHGAGLGLIMLAVGLMMRPASSASSASST
ncbi:DMT family transporter [Glaciecola siphonariae]|uniref:DMT family transporter n=1 Tax=Glaciecola siphonariae TaxID=521012 RepID=A0ABV9LTJ5_9ALTE